MGSLRAWGLRLAGLFTGRRRGEQFDAELQSHLEMHIEDNIRQGMTPGEARRMALLALGGAQRTRDAYRDRGTFPLVESLARDAGGAVRRLRRRPVFAAVGVLSLAVGIGANTAVFSFANGILIRALRVEGAGRLVILRQHNEAFGGESCCLSQNVLRQLQREDVGFDALLGVFHEQVLVRDRAQSERLDAEFVTTNYFSMLGVQPAAGRLLDARDDSPGAAVAVISYDLWTSRFGASSDAIGRRIDIDDVPFQIVGVTEPGFTGLSLNAPRDLQLPAAAMATLSHGNRLEAVGRLRPDVSEEQALARLNAVGKALQRQSGLSVDDKDAFRFLDGSQGFHSGKEELRLPLLILGILAAVVLLVVCANLAALLMMGSSERVRDAGLRAALGATRFALFRQNLTDSLLLATLGGVAAWGIAHLLIGILSGYVAPDSPGLPTHVQPDATVFAFSAMITVAAALLFGTWPSWQASNANPLPAVRGAARPARGRPTVSRGIVSAQVALSLALLFSAGLFSRTLANLRSIDLGFQPENLILLQPDLEGTVHAGRAALPYFEELLRRTEDLPAVRAASLGVFGPLSDSTLASPLSIPGYGTAGAPEPTALMYYVSSGYFRTMGIPFLDGEDFPRDTRGSRSVIINEELARKHFGSEAIGRTFSVYGSSLQVIGVVGITKYRSLREAPQPIFYLPIVDVPPRIIQVRISGDPVEAIARMTALMQSLDPHVRLRSATTMDAQLDEILARERLLAFLSTLLGVAAVALSAIGLYGVLAFSVARRTHEIGVRIAVGASRSGVVAMFVKEGGWIVGGGVLIGVPLALACGRTAESLLYGLSPQDAGTIAGATGLLMVSAAAATIIPAWRAARLNAVQALRHD